MPVSMVVVVFEVLDHHPRFEQARPVIAVEALRSRLLTDSMCPLFHGVPGWM